MVDVGVLRPAAHALSAVHQRDGAEQDEDDREASVDHDRGDEVWLGGVLENPWDQELGHAGEPESESAGAPRCLGPAEARVGKRLTRSPKRSC